MNKNILFVTQHMTGARAACGIGLMGKVIGEALLESKEFNFNLIYADDYQTVAEKVAEFNPSAIIYNYAPGTTPWMDHEEYRQQTPHIKHIRIMHDMHQRIADTYMPRFNHGWRYIIADDPTVNETKHVFVTNRILPGEPTVQYVEPQKPIIGFQGFGPVHKGIYRIAQKVVEEFDEATIRLHIPYGYYGDPAGHDARRRVQEVVDIVSVNPKIDVIASHELLGTQEIIDVLAQNTVNCYFYDYLDGCGIASSPDYALAANRPIAVTRSHQMRNFWNLNPSVLIENTSLKQIIANGTEPLKPLYEAYSRDNVRKDYARILNTILS